MTPPRLYVLQARAAPIALVVRRGPTEWFHLLRWDLDSLSVEAGAWFHGTIYPRRSEISPDGRLFAYFALTGRPAPWDSYYAVSKVPWLTALAAWRTGTTYTFGCEFLDDGSLSVPFRPDDPPDRGRYEGSVVARVPRATTWVGRGAFDERDVANELRRGWQPLEVRADDPHLAHLPIPDRSIHLMLRRPRPDDASTSLVLAHAGHTHSEPWIEGVEVAYLLDETDHPTLLEDVGWADWDVTGRLLVATRGGEIQVRERTDGTWRTTWSRDLNGLEPDPVEAPLWARTW
jgi:hypothetical protein